MSDDPMAKLRKCLSLHGFTGRKKYFWTAATIIKTLLLLDRMSYILLCLNQPRRLAELTASLPVSITAVLKMVHLYFDKQRVEYLYNTITNEFWEYRICGPELEKKTRSIFHLTNRGLLINFIISSVCVVLFLIFPVADMPSEDDRILPNVLLTPFDLNPSPLHEMVFFSLIISGVLTYMGNLAFDYFYIYCVQHLFLQFELLKTLLANITDGVMENSSDVEKFNSAYFQKTIKDRLKICAEHHGRLLKYGKNIEKFCSKALVPQLIMTYASLVVNGFTLSTVCLLLPVKNKNKSEKGDTYHLGGDRSNLPKTVILFNLSMSTLLQLFMFAFPSSLLHQQSLSVLDAIYDSKWYLFNAEVKRACTFMMMNGREGIVIKAGGVTRIDNPLLVEMLQKVFSAVTLLRALIE